MPGQAGFSDIDEYRQIYSTTGAPDANPGQTDNTGGKTVAWPYQTVVDELAAPPDPGTLTALSQAALDRLARTACSAGT